MMAYKGMAASNSTIRELKNPSHLNKWGGLTGLKVN